MASDNPAEGLSQDQIEQFWRKGTVSDDTCYPFAVRLAWGVALPFFLALHQVPASTTPT